MSRLKSPNRFFVLAQLFIISFLGVGCTTPASSSTPEQTAVSQLSIPLPIDNQPTEPAASETVPPPPSTPSPTPEREDAVAAEAASHSATPERQLEATATATPTLTTTPTQTPTSEPQHTPERLIISTAEGVPTAVPEFLVPEDTTTLLLLGNDGGVNTDTIMIVAINRAGPTASILSLPRDLYVYIPGKSRGRLNTVLARGGPELLKQTIQYNFGVPIHFYAQINFEGFKETVDILNGVEIAVSCELRDWRLIAPELDPEEEDNWEQFTLEPGLHKMDGDLALWYVRSRLTTSDFDRGRRQQQLLRAMLNQAVDVGIINDVPSLWAAFQDYVNTDLDIGRILQLASLAPAIRENGVQHLYVAQKTESFTTPDGANVLLPIWEGERMMQEELSRLFLPPALNMATQNPITVEIINASGNPELTVLAADNLAWFGFIPILGGDSTLTSNHTTLNYYRPNFKGSYDWLISWIFDRRISEIELVSEEDYDYDYQLTLGKDYNPCRPLMLAPQIFLPSQP